MTRAVPYLAADAAALGDAELSPKAPALRPLSDTYLTEIEYAVDLFRRAQAGLSAEFARLRGLDVEIDWKAAEAVSSTLLHAAVMLHVRALNERSRRAAGRRAA